MEVADGLAIYAAVVATAALGWQIYSWRRARVNRVAVHVRMGLLAGGNQAIEAIIITATNRGDRPVRVVGVGLDSQDGSGRQMHVAEVYAGATLPGPIDANDSGMTWVLREAAAGNGIDVIRPVTGWVHLATGETIRSRGEALLTP